MKCAKPIKIVKIKIGSVFFPSLFYQTEIIGGLGQVFLENNLYGVL